MTQGKDWAGSFAWPAFFALNAAGALAWLGASIPSNPNPGQASRQSALGAFALAAAGSLLLPFFRRRARRPPPSVLLASALLLAALACLFVPPFVSRSLTGPNNGTPLQSTLWWLGVGAFGLGSFLVLRHRFRESP